MSDSKGDIRQIEEVDRSVVRIRVANEVGSGFLVGPSDIATARHVIERGDKARIEITLAGLKLTVIDILMPPTSDPDVALIRIAERMPNWLPLGSVTKIDSRVYAFGFQYTDRNYEGYPVLGTLVGAARTDPEGHTGLLLVAEANIQPGVSGAPLYSLPDEVVIGVVKRNNPDGGGYAVPAATLFTLDPALAVRNRATSAARPIPLRGYLDQLKAEHSHVTLPGLDRALPLDSIYVTLTVCRGSAIGSPMSLSVNGSMESSSGRVLSGLTARRDLGESQRLFDAPVVPIQDFLAGGKSVVLGEPGCGKTTFLRHLLAKVASGRLLASTIPVFIPLHAVSVKVGAVLNYIIDAYPDHAESLKRALESGGCAVFADGLDELPKRSQEIVRDELVRLASRGNNIFLTCRMMGWRRGLFPSDFRVFECRGFNSSQQQRFLRKWFAQSSIDPLDIHRRLLRHRGTTGFLRNPLLVSLICLVVEIDPDHNVPTRRHDLYRLAISTLADRRRDQLDRPLTMAVIENVLTRFAFEQFSLGREVWSEQELIAWLDDYRQNIEASLDLREISSADILGQLAESFGLFTRDAGRNYKFLHLTFQEYLAALHLSKQLSWIDNVEPHVLDPRWEEVIRLLFGTASAPVARASLARLYEPASVEENLDPFRRFSLLARFASEVEALDEALLSGLISRLLQEAFASSREYRALESVQSLAILLQTHQPKFSELCDSVEQAGDRLGVYRFTLVLQLMQLVGTDIAASTLQRLYEKWAVAASSDEDAKLLLGAALRALGRCVGLRDSSWLMSVVASSDPYIASNASLALTGPISAGMFEKLCDLATSEDPLLQHRALYLLAKSPDRTHQEWALERAISVSSTSISLVQTFQAALDPDLADLSQDFLDRIKGLPGHARAWPYIAGALTLMDESATSSLLEEACIDRSRDYVERIGALQALSAIGHSSYERLVVALLEEGDCIMLTASLNCAELLRDEMLLALAKRLDSNTPFVSSNRGALLRALTRKPSRLYIPWLLNLLKTEADESSRAKALISLGNLRCLEATRAIQKSVALSSRERPLEKVAAFRAVVLMQRSDLLDQMFAVLEVETDISIIAQGIQLLGGVTNLDVESRLVEFLDPTRWPKAWPPLLSPPRKGEQRPADRRLLATVIALNQCGGSLAVQKLNEFSERAIDDAEAAQAAWAAAQTIEEGLTEVSVGE